MFVGIALDERTRATLVRTAHALERAGLDAKFELPEKLHVTLAFLGSVQADRVPQLIQQLRTALDGISEFRVRFEVVGGFPNNRRARIAWAGARRDDRAFESVAEAVRGAAREFATLDEKRPVLHVTLARLRDAARLPTVDFSPCTMDVGDVVLFESLQGEHTSRYEIVERFPLTIQTSSPPVSK